MFMRFVAGGLSLSLGLAFAASATAAADEPTAGAAKKRAEVYRQIDSDGDGFLSQSEVDASGKAAFKKIVKDGDANDDGKIDAGEFEAFGKKLTAARKEKNKGAAKPKGKAAKKPADAAKPADAVKPADGKKGDRVKQIVEKLRADDADKDGRLSRDEFRGKPLAFDRLDVDKDGFVDKADLKELRARRKAAGEKAEKEKSAEKP